MTHHQPSLYPPASQGPIPRVSCPLSAVRGRSACISCGDPCLGHKVREGQGWQTAPWSSFCARHRATTAALTCEFYEAGAVIQPAAQGCRTEVQSQAFPVTLSASPVARGPLSGDPGGPLAGPRHHLASV